MNACFEVMSIVLFMNNVLSHYKIMTLIAFKDNEIINQCRNFKFRMKVLLKYSLII